jgi:hypothetical protein
MSVARRIVQHFVSPADGRATRADARPVGVPPTRACAVPPPRTPSVVAVLAPPADAPALGAVLGLALARRERAPVAVVCIWSPAPTRALWRAPALPAAVRLAAALTARGHDARGSGRLVVVRLAAPCEEAAAEVLRASAAAGSAPVVLALAGPRAAAFDAVLAAQDLVVVALPPESDPALARLAVAGLERGLTCEIPAGHPARSLAAAGLALLPSARRAFAAPVAALS